MHPALIAYLQRRLKAGAVLGDRQERSRSLLDGFAQASWAAGPTGLMAGDSPSWREFTGQTVEEWLGSGWLAAVHPEDRPGVERRWREAVTSIWSFDAECRLQVADGGWRWTNMRALPMLDDDGSIRRWVGINIDIDERKNAEAALRQSEELRRVAIAGGRMGNWHKDTRRHVIWGDAAFLALWGFPPSSDPQPFSLFMERMDSDGQRQMNTLMSRTAEGGEDFDGEMEVVAGPTAGCWIGWRGRTDQDEPWIINGVSFDVTQQRRMAERLRESDERFRQFAKASSDALWIRDAATLQMEYISPASESIYGVPPAVLVGSPRNWTSLIVPEDRDAALAHVQQVTAGEPVTHEFRIERPSDGALRWIRNTVFPLFDAHGRVQRVGGIAQDVTEAKRASERQDLLVAELQHRTRNLIAVVGSIANQTMDETGPTEAFRHAFADRLSALSRVQGLLSRSEAEPITIGALVQLELAALGTGVPAGQVTVEGAEVFLKPSTVQTLALALHELATNARKYGALSHERGELTITWRERIEGEEHRLTLEWVETGGEHVSDQPLWKMKDGGYGRELIEHALPHALGARTTFVLTQTGLRCTIDTSVRPTFPEGKRLQ